MGYPTPVILHMSHQCHSHAAQNFAVVAHAGEGTLEAQLVRLQLRSMAENDGLFDFDKFLQKYVTFMTTPGSHNDTYAGVSAPTAGPTLVWVEAFCTADTPPPTLRLLSHGFLIMCVCV